MFRTLPCYFRLHCKLHSRRSCPRSVLKQWKLVCTDTEEPSSKSNIFLRQNELSTNSHMTSDRPMYSENWCLFPGVFQPIIKSTGDWEPCHGNIVHDSLFSLSQERKLKVCRDLFKLHLCFANSSPYFPSLDATPGKDTLCLSGTLHSSNGQKKTSS